MGTSSAGSGRPGLAALAAGAAIGLAAAAAAALLERLRRIPVQPGSRADVPDPGPAGSVPISARKDPNLPDWRQGMPGTPGTVTVEVSSLDAGTGGPRRNWVVHSGPQWQSRPGELMVPPNQAGTDPGISL